MAVNIEAKKIVVVDNNLHWLEEAALILGMLGVVVEKINSNGMDSADSGEDLVELITEKNPDLVISGLRNERDEDSKDYTGLELLKDLQEQISVPLVLMPEEVDTEDGEFSSTVKEYGFLFYTQDELRKLASAIPKLLEL